MAESATLPVTDVPGEATSNLADYVPGTLIGEKYRLRRFLGEGSQGSVWLAENIALAADVAVKIVHADASNPAPTLRLEKEARVAARIGHPGVVRVFDLGRTERGDAFIVMEYLQGQNLGECLTTSGRLSPLEAVRTLLPIADVLHVAHDAGIVHRDLKPENVFLAKNGTTIQPKLLDFGIAKRRAGPDSNEPVITDVGVLVGSPAYLSPEQASCRGDVGRAADVWSFCVVLFECLTGALPFASDDYRELFRQIDEEPPRSMVVYGVADVELWAIVRRGLAKSPDDRWPDMQSLGRALAVWLKARGVQDDISGMRLDSRWLWRRRGEPAVAVSGRERESARPSARPPEPVAHGGSASRTRRSPTLALALGGIVALVTPLALAYGLLTPRPATDARELERAAQTPRPSPPPPVLTELAATTAPAGPPREPPAAPVTTVPHASQRATPNRTSSARPSASEPARAGTEPASAQTARPKPVFDLIEPY